MQCGHLALIGGVGERELILLGLIPFRDSLLPREIVGQFAEAGGVSGGGDAIRRRLLQRIEGAGDRALRLRCDGGLLRRAEARIVQNAFDTAS